MAGALGEKKQGPGKEGVGGEGSDPSSCRLPRKRSLAFFLLCLTYKNVFGFFCSLGLAYEPIRLK